MFYEFCERGGGDGGGRLHIEPDSAEFEQGSFDLGFRNCNGRAAGTPQRSQHFAGPHWLCDRRALGDCSTDLNRRNIFGPGLEACVKRRAILRLRRKQPGSTSDLAAAQKLAEADIATHDVAARASRDDNIVRRVELQILPKL